MIQKILKSWCDENNIPVSDEQLNKFEMYAQLLKEWNEKMNLTAITDDEGIAVKHFIDSISLCKYVSFSGKQKVIDIGTGAGFPGIPLKIMFPEIELTLLDSLNKRLVFLNEVCSRLGIIAELVHSRAEEGALKPLYREQYDVSVSRAVANLPALCEYCMPYVKKGGIFISMKGPDGEKELSAANNAIDILGGKLKEINNLTLPDESSRTVIVVLKVKSTPQKYPRRGQKINKNPI